MHTTGCGVTGPTHRVKTYGRRGPQRGIGLCPHDITRTKGFASVGVKHEKEGGRAHHRMWRHRADTPREDVRPEGAAKRDRSLSTERAASVVAAGDSDAGGRRVRTPRVPFEAVATPRRRRATERAASVVAAGDSDAETIKGESSQFSIGPFPCTTVRRPQHRLPNLRGQSHSPAPHQGGTILHSSAAKRGKESLL